MEAALSKFCSYVRLYLSSCVGIVVVVVVVVVVVECCSIVVVVVVTGHQVLWVIVVVAETSVSRVLPELRVYE